ncbi:MAG: YceI family protein [Bdellovibrionales bacterium]
MNLVAKSVILVCLLYSWAVYPEGVEIGVSLSPAGSFVAKTKKVTGSAYKTADGIAAENVVVDLKSITTGIGLRDKHTKERLMVSKYPQAKLIKAVGKGGKGVAKIEIKGKQQTVRGTYKVEGNVLKAEFPMRLPDLDIKDVRYMGVGVKDTVTVKIELPLSKAPQRSTASTNKKKK